jgi:CheY-like chemotaxis protein
MDGLEAGRLIVGHRTKQEPSPKAIFLSAHATESYKEKTLDAGGDGFISNPYKLGQIQSVLTPICSCEIIVT